MAPSRGINFDKLDDLKHQVKRAAQLSYDKFINDPKRENAKKLCIEAYEKILMEKRMQERLILNAKRRVEIEKNRPPQPGWYETKTGDFAKEVYRNRVDLKPRNSNKEYL